MALAHTYYYTDPACPWSWALEPSFRKLRHEFGERLNITYVMCGMARAFGDPIPLVAEMLEAADQSGMPVDPRLWLTAAPRSSYPACIAVKAAAEQGDPGSYLRRLREGVQCRRRKLDGTDALLEEARSVPGLDLDKLRFALGSHAALEAFGADLDRARAVPAEHHSPGTGRVRLPSLEFVDSDGGVHGVYGFADYGSLRSAALAAGAGPEAGGARAEAAGVGPEAGGARPEADAVPPEAGGAPAEASAGAGVEDALRRWGSMATAEVAAVCDLPGPRAPAELWRLALGWRVKPERLGSGELWSALT
jgi:predicted DsbA family dithiol-disulfide isomerase